MKVWQLETDRFRCGMAEEGLLVQRAHTDTSRFAVPQLENDG